MPTYTAHQSNVIAEQRWNLVLIELIIRLACWPSFFLDRHLFPEAGLLAIGHFDLLVTSHLLFVFFSYFQLLKNNLWLTVHQ